MACVAVLAVVVALALQNGLSPEHRGVALGAPADPAWPYAAARPEWSFRGLYQLRESFPASLEVVPIFVIPGLVVLVLLMMPWIGRGRIGHWLNVAVIVVLGGGLAALSWRSLAADAADKDYQAALAAANWRAGEIKEMIAPELGRLPRIPPGGALALQRRVFGCSLCHELTAGRGAVPRPEGLATTAPDLYRFASREWLTDFLDPKQISGPRFFGNTKFQTRGDADVRQENARQTRRQGQRGSEESDRGPLGRGGLAVAAGNRRPRCREDQAGAGRFRHVRLHRLPQVPRGGGTRRSAPS